MELRSLVEMMVTDGVFMRIANDPLSQFGPKTRRYLGAEILPENLNIPGNTYKEEYIEFRSVIANAGTRYSPPQLKGNTLVGSVFVDLAESDIASEFTASDYDAMIRIIERLPNVREIKEVPPEAMAKMIQWADTTINAPLIEFNEYMRWQAIVDGAITLLGDNGFQETVEYYQPAGHRVNTAGDWSDPSYDPYPEFASAKLMLLSKGYTVDRIFAGSNVIETLLTNPNVLRRLGIVSLISGTVTGMAAAADLPQLNRKLAGDNLPPIERYDLQYRMSIGTQYFLDRNSVVFICTTGRDRTVDPGDKEPFTLPNTLGYVGIGRPANRNVNGRATVIEYNDGKGAPVKGTGWQTSLPVIENPEAIYVIQNITTDFTQFPQAEPPTG